MIPIIPLAVDHGSLPRAGRAVSILLVDNFWINRSPSGLTTEVSPHLGLMSLAAVLREAGHVVRLLDPKILYLEGRYGEPSDGFYDACATAGIEAGCEITGFTAYGRTLPSAIRIAQRMRALRPEMPILLGGPHATIIGGKLLEAFDCFSVIVRYEAELNIVPLVEALAYGEDLSAIPNLAIRAGGAIVETRQDQRLVDVATLPRPALDLYPRRFVERGEMSLEAGRGCPFACTFCSTAGFFQREYRLKSNPAIVAEMEAARAEFKVRVFNLNHDLFGLRRSSLLEFCRLVEGRGFSWKCSMRPDTLRIEDIESLKVAGCIGIYFGIETGSAKLQRDTKKRLRLVAAEQVVRAAVAAGIGCTVSFITGFPEETEEDQRRTLDLAGSLIDIDPTHVDAQLHMLSPEPGSELMASESAFRFDGVGPEADAGYDPDLVVRYPEIFSVFYHFDSRLPRWRVILASALVNDLIPHAGRPLVAWLLREQFGRSLAAFFDALFPEAPSSPLNSYDDILFTLRERFAQVCRTNTAPRERDAITLARVLSGAAEDAGLWITQFHHPIEQAFGQLRLPLQHRVTLEAAASGAGPFRYILNPSGSSLEIFSLAGAEGLSALDVACAAAGPASAAELARDGFVRIADLPNSSSRLPTLGGHRD